MVANARLNSMVCMKSKAGAPPLINWSFARTFERVHPTMVANNTV